MIRGKVSEEASRSIKPLEEPLVASSRATGTPRHWHRYLLRRWAGSAGLTGQAIRVDSPRIRSALQWSQAL
jgi:hypothetical protein